MNESLTPDAILSDVSRGKIKHSLAVDLLLSLIERSDNSELRKNCLVALQKLDIPKETEEKTYKTIESCLLSDEDQLVRKSAAVLISEKLLEYGTNALSWSIKHDSSPLVLKSLLDLFLEKFPRVSEKLTKRLQEWLLNYANRLEIVPKEAIFFLEVECLFAHRITDYMISQNSFSYFQYLMNIKSSPFIYIDNGHVKELRFNYYNWLYLKENQDIIDSFSKVKDLNIFLSLHRRYDLQFKELKALPSTIGNLNYLEVLDLSSNGIKIIPPYIFSLFKIRELDLSKNYIQEIPISLSKLKQLKVLNLKNNKLDTLPSVIEDYLGSLDTFQY